MKGKDRDDDLDQNIRYYLESRGNKTSSVQVEGKPTGLVTAGLGTAI